MRQMYRNSSHPMARSKPKCNTSVEGQFGIDVELRQEGLYRGFEAQAFARREIVHEIDAGETLAAHLVDIEVSRQIVVQAAVHILRCALLL